MSLMDVLPTFANFAAVLFIVVKFGRKPLQDFLVSRSQTIQSEVAAAGKASAEVDRELKEWEDKTREAPKIFAQMLEDAKSLVQRTREQTLTQAKSEAERIERDATLFQGSETAKAKKTLAREIVHESLAKAQATLRSELDDKGKQALVSDYLSIVGTADAR